MNFENKKEISVSPLYRPTEPKPVEEADTGPSRSLTTTMELVELTLHHHMFRGICKPWHWI
jgi:hypothetical protein